MKILRANEVSQITGLSNSTIYAYMAANKFPKSLLISERCTGWLESEVVAWIEERVAKRGYNE